MTLLVRQNLFEVAFSRQGEVPFYASHCRPALFAEDMRGFTTSSGYAVWKTGNHT